MIERINNGESPENIDAELLKSFDIHSVGLGTSSNIEVEEKIKKLKNRFKNLSKFYVERNEIEELKNSIDERVSEIIKAEKE